MTAALLIALLAQQPEPSGDSLAIRFEAWRPSVRGRMSVDEAFGVDFLDEDAPASGRFSFENDGGLGDPTPAFRFTAFILEPAGKGYFFHVERARWRGSRTLTEDEDLGGGMTLPAGTDVRSALHYWEAEVGGLTRKEGSVFTTEGEWALAFYKLDLKADDVKAGTGGFGPILRGRLGLPVIESIRTEVSGMLHFPLFKGAIRFEFGARLVFTWGMSRIDLGYSNLFGEEGGESPNRFSFGGPSLGLALYF